MQTNPPVPNRGVLLDREIFVNLRLKLYSSVWHSLFSCDVGLIGDNSANVIWRHETEAKQPHYENWLLPCNQITMELMYIHCELYVIKEQ